MGCDTEYSKVAWASRPWIHERDSRAGRSCHALVTSRYASGFQTSGKKCTIQKFKTYQPKRPERVEIMGGKPFKTPFFGGQVKQIESKSQGKPWFLPAKTQCSQKKNHNNGFAPCGLVEVPLSFRLLAETNSGWLSFPTRQTSRCEENKSELMLDTNRQTRLHCWARRNEC